MIRGIIFIKVQCQLDGDLI